MFASRVISCWLQIPILKDLERCNGKLLPIALGSSNFPTSSISLSMHGVGSFPILIDFFVSWWATCLRHTSPAMNPHWKTDRDIANVSGFELTWGRLGNQDVLLISVDFSWIFSVPFLSLDKMATTLPCCTAWGTDCSWGICKQVSYLCFALDQAVPIELKCEILEMKQTRHTSAYKPHVVFLCDWPEEDKHLERFEVFLEDGHGKHLGDHRGWTKEWVATTVPHSGLPERRVAGR